MWGQQCFVRHGIYRKTLNLNMAIAIGEFKSSYGLQKRRHLIIFLEAINVLCYLFIAY